MIKPVYGGQSYGVVKICNTNNIKDTIKKVDFSIKKSDFGIFKQVSDQKFLIEEYLSGKTISIDGLVQDGEIFIAGSIEFMMGKEPYFVQEANIIPADLNTEEILKCEEEVKNIIKVIKLNNCAYHCEMRLVKDKPYLIEITARLPGGPLLLGYKKAYGIDLISKLIDIWFNKKIQLKHKYTKHILQKAVFSNQEGVLKSVEGVNKANEIKEIWDFKQIAFPKDVLNLPPNVPKPIYYYAIASNSKKKNSISKKIESTIKYSVI